MRYAFDTLGFVWVRNSTAWKTPEGHGLRTVSGRARGSDYHLYVSSFPPTTSTLSYVYTVVTSALMRGDASSAVWKRIAASQPNTILRAVSITPYDASVTQPSPSSTMSISPSPSATQTPVSLSATPSPTRSNTASVSGSRTATSSITPSSRCALFNCCTA